MSAAPGSAAENPSDKLEGVQQELEKHEARESELKRASEKLDREIDKIRGQLVHAAKATQEHEAKVSALEDRLEKLKAEAERKRAALRQEEGRMSRTLAVLQRISLYPTAAALTAPGDPNNAVRSALLLGRVLPHLEGRAEALGEELRQVKAIYGKIDKEHRALDEATRELGQDRERLQGLIDKKRRLVKQTEAERKQEAKRIAALTKTARNLRELLAGIEREQKARPRPQPRRFTRPTSLRPFSKARGRMRVPARGLIVRYFGQPTDTGLASKGMLIQTRPQARVVAPFDGKVVFAGPFRGYGQILIIEHSEGYHTLLAGFSRIDSVPDQYLLAGEPVGVIDRPDTATPTLYVELREKGRPINPLPWLAAQR